MDVSRLALVTVAAALATSYRDPHDDTDDIELIYLAMQLTKRSGHDLQGVTCNMVVMMVGLAPATLALGRLGCRVILVVLASFRALGGRRFRRLRSWLALRARPRR